MKMRVLDGAADISARACDALNQGRKIGSDAESAIYLSRAACLNHRPMRTMASFDAAHSRILNSAID
jgi:hypothetical protein